MNMAACVLVVNKDGDILSVSRKDDSSLWGLPGGKCEPNESMRSAAIRETLEETGHLVELSEYYYFDMECHNFFVRTYLAKIIELDYNVIDETEIGLVAFKSRAVLEDEKSPFYVYNRKCFEYLLY